MVYPRSANAFFLYVSSELDAALGVVRKWSDAEP